MKTDETNIHTNTSEPECWCAHLKHHSGFFQQICSHVGTDDAKAVVEADLDVFPETTAVIVPGCLRISNGLRDGRKTWRQKQSACYGERLPYFFIQIVLMSHICSVRLKGISTKMKQIITIRVKPISGLLWF